MLAPTSDFTELVFFFLAHVNRQRLDSLASPAQVQDAQRWLSAHAQDRLRETAPLLVDVSGQALQWWPELFSSLEHYAGACDRALCELAPDDVAASTVLARLRGDGRHGELVHAELALLREEFAARHASDLGPSVAEQLGPVAEALALLPQREPGFADASFELSACLGDHGRVFPSRIVVGAPMPWNELTPECSACWAVHEWLVQRADAPYLDSEWRALLEAGPLVSGTPIEHARRRWLGRLNLGPIFDGLENAKILDEDRATRLRSDPTRLQDRETYGPLLGLG